jgi:hypothetical protein
VLVKIRRWVVSHQERARMEGLSDSSTRYVPERDHGESDPSGSWTDTLKLYTKAHGAKVRTGSSAFVRCLT